MTEQIGRQAVRQSLAQRMLLGCSIVGAVLGASTVLLGELGISLPPALILGGGLVAVAVLLWVSVIYWQNIDEAAREAHTFAWFWGGSGGLLLMLPVAAAIRGDMLIAVFGQKSPSDWVWLGFGALLAAQLIGYGLVWTIWWLRRR